MGGRVTSGRPTLAEVLSATTWPDGGRDGMPTRLVAERFLAPAVLAWLRETLADEALVESVSEAIAPVAEADGFPAAWRDAARVAIAAVRDAIEARAVGR